MGLYVKALLYAYPNLQEIIEQIDELVEKKALLSIADNTPCVTQCHKILELTWQKDVLLFLKADLDKVLSKFSLDELDCLDYKYFKRKPKEYYKDFDSSSRGYFRKQIKVYLKVAKYAEKAGMDEKWFEDTCLEIEFFRELLKRVVDIERKSIKNKRASVKEMGRLRKSA